MAKERSILFVCTGNVFRSVAAEYSLKKYLELKGVSDWTVSSAGTDAHPIELDSSVVKALAEFGADVSNHTPRRLTRDILDAHDIVIGMAEDHLAFMKAEFGYRQALLFNDLAIGELTSVRDVPDEVPDYLTNHGAMEEVVLRTVRDIHAKVPGLFRSAEERYYLFSDFVTGKRHHRNGYPFIALHETPHSVAFMSIDIPYKEDGHILVIPKTRYVDLADVPGEVLADIFDAVKRIGDAVVADHGGYNLLLNNGRDAGQYMMHAHLHIIPRRLGDDIRIEGWEHPAIKKEDFVQMNERLKQRIAAG